ncbi:MAG: hypothetical protein IH593_13510 [Bacteroidales bacterium]|nr:hypothetical protein [Bacteroidales bacterium]
MPDESDDAKHIPNIKTDVHSPVESDIEEVIPAQVTGCFTCKSSTVIRELFCISILYNYFSEIFFRSGRNSSRTVSPPRQANTTYIIVNSPSMIPVNQNVDGKPSTNQMKIKSWTT